MSPAQNSVWVDLTSIPFANENATGITVQDLAKHCHFEGEQRLRNPLGILSLRSG
jgi:hypothetical protein